MKLKLLLVVVVLLTAAVAPAMGAPAPPDQTTESHTAPVKAVQETANNSTETPTATPTETEENATASPDAAQTVRILPVQLEADFASITTAEQGEIYNTTGPFAFFSISEPVDQVAVQQQGGKATVLEGGRQVRVQYASDAAPVGKQSLFTLQLWFEDGSTTEVDLYASETSVSVGAAEMKKYRPLIMEMLMDAEQNGYERSPEGVEQHYANVQETAQLLDSLFTEQAKRLLGSIIGIFRNPLGIALTLITLALLAVWSLRRNARVLEVLSSGPSKAEQLRERLWIQYRKQQQTAADEQLRELSGVGEMGEIYWDDAFGVDTTAGLAELFRTGVPVKRDGEVQHIGGVDELKAESIESSWLEAVCRDQRLPSPEIALTHGKTALRRMICEYGMGHHYNETYDQVSELIDELDQSRDLTRHSSTTFSGSSTSSAAGGDD